MSIPKFKPAKHYLDEYAIPCRLAKVKNSQLPGMATRAIARSKEDSVCEIYLHGKGAKDFSAWEKEVLEELFVNGRLAAIVESAMKEHAKDADGYADAKPAEREEIRKIGIAPFMTIYRMVIDGDRQEAILCARTELDLNLIEHGINIHLQKGKWHFSDDQYFISYADKLGPGLDESEEPTSDEKRFDKLFPRPKRGVPVEKDTAILHGKWIYNQAKTEKLFLKLGRPVKRLDSEVAPPPDSTLEFTSKTIKYTRNGMPFWDFLILGCERTGNCIALQCQSQFGNQKTMLYWLDDGNLVNDLGIVFLRARV